MRWLIVVGTLVWSTFGVLHIASAAPVEPPTLEVENPEEDAFLPQGALVMHGVAYDEEALRGTGVDRVSVFLGDRDRGGRFLGNATLGRPNPLNPERSQFRTAGWIVTTQPLMGHGEDRELFVYARSSITGKEAIVRIPVTIGEEVEDEGGEGEEHDDDDDD